VVHDRSASPIFNDHVARKPDVDEVLKTFRVTAEALLHFAKLR